MITFSQVGKTTDGSTWLVKDVSLIIPTGELLVILGASGAGKTTLLKMINRLVEISCGTITVQGRSIAEYDLPNLRRLLGYVFQGVGLFPHMTIAENIAIGLRLLRQKRAQRQQRAYELLALMGLEPKQFADRYPHQLSGGQQQRVGVARALAADPDYLLMDEPFGALDPLTRADLQQEILRLNQQFKKTIIFVTHDVMEALRLGQRMAIMNHGQLEQVGTPQEIIYQPQTPFVKNLMQASLDKLMSLLPQQRSKDASSIIAG